MPKVVFVNRYFHPDQSATSRVLSELAFDLAGSGREVHVVTSRQLYGDPGKSLAGAEIVNGVKVHRVPTTSFGRGRIAGRSIDYLTFHLAAFAYLLRLLSRGDVVVAKTDPPLISVTACLVAVLRKAVLVNWLQDVFPEVAQHLGVGAARGLAGRAARYLRDFSLRRAAITVVLGDRMASTVLAATGLPKDRLRIIHNWADAREITPIPEGASTLRRQWNLDDAFVVAYSGNMGRVHEFATVLGAIESLRDEAGLVFLFIGDGNRAAWLRGEIGRRGLLERVRFLPYQPHERLAESLAAAEVHLVTLQPSLEGLVVPSKFYGIAAAARPVLFIGDPGGEIGSLIARHDCGFSVRSGDSEALATCIRRLMQDPALRGRLGENARAALLEHYERRLALAKWSSVLDEAAAGTAR